MYLPIISCRNLARGLIFTIRQSTINKPLFLFLTMSLDEHVNHTITKASIPLNLCQCILITCATKNLQNMNLILEYNTFAFNTDLTNTHREKLGSIKRQALISCVNAYRHFWASLHRLEFFTHNHS